MSITKTTLKLTWKFTRVLQYFTSFAHEISSFTAISFPSNFFVKFPRVINSEFPNSSISFSSDCVVRGCILIFHTSSEPAQPWLRVISARWWWDVHRMKCWTGCCRCRAHRVFRIASSSPSRCNRASASSLVWPRRWSNGRTSWCGSRWVRIPSRRSSLCNCIGCRRSWRRCRRPDQRHATVDPSDANDATKGRVVSRNRPTNRETAATTTAPKTWLKI